MAIFSFSCEHYPKDPQNSLSQIEGGEIHVGLIHNPPFVNYNSDDTSGIEVNLVKEFAARHQAEILWIPGSEGNLMEKIQNFEIHLVIGGLKQSTPYRTRIGITRPYHRELVMAVPQGENRLLIELEYFLKGQELTIRKEMLSHD